MPVNYCDIFQKKWESGKIVGRSGMSHLQYSLKTTFVIVKEKVFLN